MTTKEFSIPEVPVMLDERQYIMASDLISTAATLFGDGNGGQLGANSEYERGAAELICRFMSWGGDLVPSVVTAIHGYAKDNQR